MKTRNIIAILAVLPIVAGFTSCKSDDDLTAKPAKEILRVEGGGVELRASDKTVDVKVYADCAWQVLDSDGGDFGKKLSVSPKAGNGNGTLVIMVDENTGTAERKDTIILKSAGGLMQKIPIRQVSGDPAMNLSQDAFTFTADETTQKPLTITSNENWTLSVPPGAWFNVTDANGSAVTSGSAGATTVYVSANPCTTDAERTLSFSIAYSGKSTEVTVSQSGMAEIYLSAPEELEVFETHGGEQMLRIESNAQWQVFVPSSVDWLHIEGQYNHDYQRDNNGVASGVGNGELRIYCEENNTTRERLTAIVIIAGTKNPKQAVVLVEQLKSGSVQPLQTSVTLSGLSVSRHSANFLVNIVSEEEVGDYGLVYSRDTEYPTVENSEHAMIGGGGTSQSLFYELNGLEENTTYFVRAFVRKMNTQEVVYSDVVPVTTKMSTLTIGDLTSLYVSNTSAEFRFSFVSDDEVIDYGLVYSDSSQEPTGDNGKMVTVGRGGTGGNVMGSIANLQELTTYYVRGYVLTSTGHSYTPNVVTITTSSSKQEPGESDNPDPTL